LNPVLVPSDSLECGRTITELREELVAFFHLMGFLCRGFVERKNAVSEARVDFVLMENLQQ
jgi:hypothetical protein